MSVLFGQLSCVHKSGLQHGTWTVALAQAVRDKIAVAGAWPRTSTVEGENAYSEDFPGWNSFDVGNQYNSNAEVLALCCRGYM